MTHRAVERSTHDVDVAAIGRLIGDPSRATILMALLDGRALTAGELARTARLAPATASAHLSKLLDAHMVTMVPQGRHRYFRLAGTEIANMLEALAQVGPPARLTGLRMSAAARALRPARMCYDHVAGQLGVRIHDHLGSIGGVVTSVDGLELTAAGQRWFTRSGVDVAGALSRRRPAMRPCLDWTERRTHLAGSLAAALADAMLDQRWLVRRAPGERGLDITAAGELALADLFDSRAGAVAVDRAC